MRARMTRLREDFVEQLRAACPQRDFGFITRQRGMFSLLGITAAQVQAMRTEHHVYMTDDSRINIAGLRAGNIAYVAHALAQVLGKGRLANRAAPSRSCRGRRRQSRRRAAPCPRAPRAVRRRSAGIANTRRRGAYNFGKSLLCHALSGRGRAAQDHDLGRVQRSPRARATGSHATRDSAASAAQALRSVRSRGVKIARLAEQVTHAQRAQTRQRHCRPGSHRRSEIFERCMSAS